MSWSSFRRAALVGVLVSLMAPAVASGAGSRKPNAMAAKLDEMGKKAYKEQQWDDAVAAFEAAYEADPLPRFLYNLGRIYEKRESYAQAIRHLERYLESSGEIDDREDTTARIMLIEIKLKKSRSLVEIDTEPSGALVQLQGAKGEFEQQAPMRDWLPFGEYAMTLSLEGYESFSKKVVVQPKTQFSLTVPLEEAEPFRPTSPTLVEVGPATEESPESAEGAPDEASPTEQPTAEASAQTEPAEAAPQEGSSSGFRLAPWATMALGGLLLATGGVYGSLASASVVERDNLLAEGRRGDGEGTVLLADIRAKDDEAKSQAGIATATFVLGAAALAGGAGLLFFGGDAVGSGPGWWIAAEPVVSPLGGGLRVVGRY